jgi:NADH-quinone oxidoreductase subunit C
LEQIQPSLIAETLQEKFGIDIISTEMLYDIMTITINKDKIIDVINFLYKHPIIQMQYLTTLCGMHFPHHESDKQMGMVYHLHSLVNNVRVRIKFFFADDTAIEIPTLTTIFPAANWMERETYDFFGFKFKGHPDLRRILNVDEMVSFPMRKEHPLEDPTRVDKDDTMFGR